MEVIDQGVVATSQVGDNVGAESGGTYSSHSPPLVQQPSQGNTSSHSPEEGHVDDTSGLWFQCSILGYLYKTGHCLIWHPFKPFWRSFSY